MFNDGKNKHSMGVLRRVDALSKKAHAEEPSETYWRETRREERRPAYKIATLTLPDGEIMRGVVRNFSPSGAMFVIEGAIALPHEFSVEIEGLRARTPARLIWQRGSEVGIAFSRTKPAI
ncbi:MAG: PilZ domain-containing protein [Pseudomonadota bacterium]